MACVKACWARPTCEVCGKPKAPTGRSVPLEMCSSYCDSYECPGYFKPPFAGHLWLGEEAPA